MIVKRIFMQSVFNFYSDGLLQFKVVTINICWCAAGCGGSFWIPGCIKRGSCYRWSQIQCTWQQSGWVWTSWHVWAFWLARLNRWGFPGTNSCVLLHCAVKWWSMDHKVLQWPKQVCWKFQKKTVRFFLGIRKCSFSSSQINYGINPY